MKATIVPIVSSPSDTRFDPNQITPTLEAFTTRSTTGNSRAIRRPAVREVSVRSRFTFSNRTASSG